MREDRLCLSGVLRAVGRRGARRRPHRTLALAALGLGLVGSAAVADPVPRLIWNASASVARGLYWLSGGAPARGDLVLAEPPPAARRLAAARGYLPAGVPLVKRVAAVSGDVVCGAGGAVFIDGRLAARRLSHDGQGRKLPQWQGCRTLGAEEVFLLMAGVPDSFDGRYFGAIRRTAVVGTLVPLWTE